MKKVEAAANNKALNALMINFVSKKDIISHDLSLLVNRMIVLGNVSADELEAKLKELTEAYNKMDTLERFFDEDYGIKSMPPPGELPPSKEKAKQPPL